MKEFKSFYKTVGGNEGTLCKYNTRLDTYGCGCSHDCKYCYAKSLLGFRGLWHPEDPAVADIEKIARKINKIPKGTIVRLGGMTDCFQKTEALHRVTLRTIRLLNEAGIGYLIVTKSPMVAMPEYMDAMDRDLTHIQITVTTTEDELSRTYEQAPVPSARIKAAERLQANGFDVAVRLSPFIHGYLDYEKLAGVKVDKAVVEFLRVNSWIKKWFGIDYTDYTLKHGGYLHLPLEKKIEYLDELKARTNFREITVCEDVPEHYAYWNKVNPNPDDCCNLRKGGR